MAEALGRIRRLTGATSVATGNTDGKGGKSQPQPSQSSSKTTRKKGKGTLPRTTEAEGKGESITESCCECQDIDKGMLEAMLKYKSLHCMVLYKMRDTGNCTGQSES